MFQNIDAVQSALESQNYIAERGLVTAIYLALRLNKPLFLEGEAGVGKTEIAKVLAKILDTDLIRLQCYEGLNVNTALYEWNYAHQLLHLRLLEASGATREEMQAGLFTPEFLQARPLLQALEMSANGRPPVLLIDEIDRADEEFEAFLLELLSDFQVTIPELGTIQAPVPPVVVVTSNRTREIHDALKRRCLYYWIDYPNFQKELAIVRAKAPDAEINLAKQVTAFIQELRRMELFKAPGVAETLDWTMALITLDQQTLSPEIIEQTAGVILKYQEDVQMLTGEALQSALDRARMQMTAQM
ncbi:MAG: ATPase [Chloroflexota bacterium]|nr:MoxR family ATPase [Chloroflexota bacterium]NOG65970.1 MoxR family ATPase [Chloroflexota bacterium]GIK65396.1 MAG: ATPase [Chloroflexota bacterium]